MDTRHDSPPPKRQRTAESLEISPVSDCFSPVSSALGAESTDALRSLNCASKFDCEAVKLPTTAVCDHMIKKIPRLLRRGLFTNIENLRRLQHFEWPNGLPAGVLAAGQIW